MSIRLLAAEIDRSDFDRAKARQQGNAKLLIITETILGNLNNGSKTATAVPTAADKNLNNRADFTPALL